MILSSSLAPWYQVLPNKEESLRGFTEDSRVHVLRAEGAHACGQRGTLIVPAGQSTCLDTASSCFLWNYNGPKWFYSWREGIRKTWPVVALLLKCSNISQDYWGILYKGSCVVGLGCELDRIWNCIWTRFWACFLKNTWGREEELSSGPRVAQVQRIRRKPPVACLPSLLEWVSLYEAAILGWHHTPASLSFQPGTNSSGLGQMWTFRR